MINSFTSQAVRKGHPDILADAIADAVLTDILSKDKSARVACEVMVSKNVVIISGEITTFAFCDFNNIVKKTISEAGYFNFEDGISPNCAVIPIISMQSPDISNGICSGEKLGAGDQGFQIGYATSQTDTMLPLSIQASHILLKIVESANVLYPSYLKPDGKCQILVSYDKNGFPKSIDKILISLQHYSYVNNDILKEYFDYYIYPEFYEYYSQYLCKKPEIQLNPSGRFVIGGPYGDTGVTGRKLAATGYGGFSRIGGGALCGKDPTKVDRSGAYYARYVAKQIVHEGFCNKIEVHVGYSIGRKQVFSLEIDTFVPENTNNDKIKKYINDNFNFEPYNIIKELKLLDVDYRKTVVSHFMDQSLP